MLLHSLLTCIVYNEKSYLSFSVQNVSFFLRLLLKIFSLTLVLSDLFMICLVVVFFMFLALGLCWVPWISGFLICIKFGTVGGVSFLQTFLPICLFFRDSSYICIRSLEFFLQLHDALFISFHSLFCVCVSFWIISIPKYSSSLVFFFLQCLICH